MCGDWKDLSHDILKQIFASCDRDDLTRCARTCKNWSDTALDDIWSELRIEDLEHLFAILVPMQPLQDSELEHVQKSDVLTRLKPTRRITQQDWRRFLPYASRVRLVDGFYDEELESYRMLSETALADIMMTSPSLGTIFPRLRDLIFEGDIIADYPWLKFFIAFLHEGLQELYIQITEFAPDEALNLLEEAVWRSPNITDLSITSIFFEQGDNIVASIASSLSTMHKLTQFKTGSCLLGPQILSTLDQLPNLRKVQFYEDTYRQGHVPNGVLPQSILPDPFPQLVDLMLQCSLSELCRYLSLGSDIAPSLLILDIDVVSGFKPSTLQDTLDKIAEAFPLLEFLEITRREDFIAFEGTAEDLEGAASPLMHSNLVPLTSMRALKTFYLRCDGVVSMTNSELCQLLSQCPSLRRLDLNHEPMVLSPTDLTINVLPMLAQACPQLENLALYVNTEVERLDPASFDTFKNLQEINFGISVVEDKYLITKLLTQFLPQSCKLVSKALFTPKEEEFFVNDAELLESRGARRKEWGQIAEWIPVMLDVRREAYERALANPEEVSSLLKVIH
ncbi:hypothetical protein SCHPADRAFT_927964 [Schizopora paradoxa]|uniref:F-box domain-containing protein n=1 Tax=Schizopora paradoxa TaxID=27342 RepID=A0A0H2RRK5_9AGAM|nr:hypothetical protein SCHPADRAFT_927964 [Schizopora paradoxa]